MSEGQKHPITRASYYGGDHEKAGQFYAFAVFCPACKSSHVFKGWQFNGNLDKPTFTPSMLSTWEGKHDGKDVKEICHSFLTDGVWNFLDDCTHEMKGQKVPVVPYPWESGI